MDTFRKWLNKPKADDKSLLARFYHADRLLTAVASELDSFDGRAEPDRCSRLVSRLRQGQDKVLSITNLIMEELLGEDRDPRSFRAKFPEEVLQENLAGQLWFGAECLAAGSSIMNREQESKEMRPLAQAVTKTLGNVRNLLRDQCLRNNVPNSKTLHLDVNDITTEQLYESLKIFDHLFAQFEMRYVSAMVQVKTKHEYEMQELICVLFSETLQRALQLGLLEQEKVDAFDPALMFSIPRLAIIAGLVIYAKGPLNMDMPADQLSEMFRPFRTILIKIRDLLRTLSKAEMLQLERLLCTNEDIQLKIPVGTSSIEAPCTDQENNNINNSSTLSSGDVGGSGDGENNNGCLPKPTEQQQRRNTSSKDCADNTNTEPQKVNSASTLRNVNANRYAIANSPSSTSSLSGDSPIHSTPSHSPSPTPSIASTSSVASTSANSSVNWSDDEEQEEGNGDVIAPSSTEDLDIVSADCASGYLIPNTNFGNLLQPQEVPLTDNFIASEDELNQRNSDEVEDMPTTSAANIDQRQCVGAHFNNAISLSSSSDLSDELTIQAMLGQEKCESLCKMYISTTDSGSGSSSCSSSNNHNNQKTTSSSSTSTSTQHVKCSKDASCARAHHNTKQSHSQSSHRHGHHHRHHHQQQHSRNHHSKAKSSQDNSLELCGKDKEASSVKSPSALHNDTSSVDSSTSSSLSDGDQHEIASARRTTGRMKFKSTENLLHRLFVCVAGVADQLQTNFASDLRQILRSVFLMNMSPAQDELDIPAKSKESELFEFRASENDVIQQESGGSNASIYSAEEVNPEQDNVFQNSSSSNSSSSNTNRTNLRHSAGATIFPRGNTIDLPGVTDDNGTSIGRNSIGRSRSLGDQENNDTTSNNRRLSTYINGRRLSSSSPRQQNGSQNQRNRINSVGSNSPTSSASSSSSESNSPLSERVSTTSIYSNNSNNNNNNNGLEANNPPLHLTNASTAAALLNVRPPAWVPDDKAPRCMSCRTPFTAFRRRHHCRNCGGVFCGVCSNASAPLPKYGLTKAVRVCRDCYQREVRANSAATHTHTAMTTTAGAS